LWNASVLAFTNKLPLRALRDQLKYDALYPNPLAITVLANNHDTPRFMSLDGATLEGAMLHVAFILSVRGIPQLYYGEEIAMEGKDDPDNRRDFPGGFPGDSRNAFTATGRRQHEEQMYEWTRSWLSLRSQHSALRQGRLVDLFYDDDVYVFARQDQKETIIVAFNRSKKEMKIDIPARAIRLADGTTLFDLREPNRTSRIANRGVLLTLPKSSATAFQAR
jgi:glycosidase